MTSAFMIICTVKGNDYLTQVYAESESGAEHKVLDLSYSGRHTYGVTNCMAYDADAMKTDCFVYTALQATPITFENLKEVIKDRNREIAAADEKEAKIEALEKQMKALQAQLDKCKEEKEALMH